jgi:hypothetical protein
MMPSTRADIVPTPPDTALSYDQSAQLMTDMTFRGRVKVACLKYADSILNEASNMPAHNTRMKWAASCYVNPDMVAGQVQAPTVMDPAVQSAGSGIDDTSLQAAVEGVINQLM